jgi:hypothetical protein
MHAALSASIVADGFDSVALAWERFAAADTLVYVDLPLLTHGRWVTKRLIKGLFRNPEAWRAVARTVLPAIWDRPSPAMT